METNKLLLAAMTTQLMIANELLRRSLVLRGEAKRGSGSAKPKFSDLNDSPKGPGDR